MKFRIVYKKWWMRIFLRPGWAMVFFFWMFVNKEKKDMTDRHYRHELEHCYQVKRMGRIKFYATYLWLWIKGGYDSHPYEVEADERANDPLTDEEKQWRVNDKVIL